MSRTYPQHRSTVLCFVLAVSISWLPAVADDTPSGAAADRYAVPDGNTEQLLAFVKKLQSYRPTTIEEFYRHREKAPAAMKAAANRILELEDKDSAPAKEARFLLLQARVESVGGQPADEQTKLVEEMTSRMDPANVGRDVQLAINLARGLEASDTEGSADLAAAVYTEVARVLAASGNARFEQMAATMEGAARRVKLVGNDMLLKGTAVDGEPFDLASLRGKVVLVDFWATWCGPCVAEYPNILANYEAYHQRGFEVVGVSLDRDRQALLDYVEQKQVPWPTLHDPSGRHPAATYYGISAIPAMILVNRDGKVVSLHARGEELNRLLKELLGPREE